MKNSIIIGILTLLFGLNLTLEAQNKEQSKAQQNAQ